MKNKNIKAIAAIGHSGTARNMPTRGQMIFGSKEGNLSKGPNKTDIKKWLDGRQLDKVILHVCLTASWRSAFGFTSKRSEYFRAPKKCWNPIGGGESHCD